MNKEEAKKQIDEQIVYIKSTRPGDLRLRNQNLATNAKDLFPNCRESKALIDERIENLLRDKLLTILTQQPQNEWKGAIDDLKENIDYMKNQNSVASWYIKKPLVKELNLTPIKLEGDVSISDWAEAKNAAYNTTIGNVEKLSNIIREAALIEGLSELEAEHEVSLHFYKYSGDNNLRTPEVFISPAGQEKLDTYAKIVYVITEEHTVVNGSVIAGITFGNLITTIYCNKLHQKLIAEATAEGLSEDKAQEQAAEYICLASDGEHRGHAWRATPKGIERLEEMMEKRKVEEPKWAARHAAEKQPRDSGRG